MSIFCGKCGSKLDEKTGLCPNCDSDKIAAKKESSVNSQINSEAVNKNRNDSQVNTYTKEPTKKEKKIKEKADKAAAKVKKKAESKIVAVKAQAKNKAAGKTDKTAAKIAKKADKKADRLAIKFDQKADKKASKAAKKASRPIGKKIGVFLLKLLAVILAIVILFSTVSGVLVYFDIADIPVISDVMNTFGIKNDDDNEQFKSLEGKFTNISINDESSAVEAAKDAAKQMGFNNAADELTLLNTSTVDGSTYYRMQENYKGIPVYGRTMVVIADENGNAQGVTSNVTDIPDNISLTPTVTQEQLNDSIKEYFKEHFEYKNTDDINIGEISEENLIIYNMNEKCVLAYKCNVSFEKEIVSVSEVITNSANGEVITTSSSLYEVNATCYNSDKSKSVKGSKNESSSQFEIFDEDRNIKVYSLNKTNIYSKDHTTEYVVSKNDIFGDSSGPNNEYENNYNAAIIYLDNISKIYDYYYKNFSDRGFGQLSALYNDSYDDGKNALGGSDSEGYGLISMGFETGVESIDTMAHEYTHVISRHNVNWVSVDEEKEENVPGAINEAYSDIFGEIIEGYLRGSDPDWKHGCRNMKNPSEFNYPQKINEKKLSIYTDSDGNKILGFEVKTEDGKKGTDYSHGYSTVVSHCAYLMTDGVKGKYEKIDTTTLASLWYKTMLSLPSNCTFNILRDYMEMTANRIGLSDTQKECIKAAFDKVGIKGTSEDKVVTYSSDSEISVFDKNGTAYDNYTIKISGKKSTGWLWFMTEDYSEEIKVENANPKRLNLPKGTYTITISDNYNSNNTRAINVKIKENSDNKEIKFASDFGFDYTVRSGANINVYDVNKAKYDDYIIKIDGTTDDKNSYSDTKTISDEYGYQLNLQNGHYNITLTDNKDSTKNKNFTVRIKDSASNSDINIETDFGKKYGQFDKSKVPSDAVEYDGHYYYIYEAKEGETNWEKAKENCESKDGYLATITSEDENKFVFTLLNKYGYKNAYFGLFDEDQNDWKWDNGETFAYSNWASGEPSSSFEDYGMYYYKYTEQWNDGNFSLPEEDGKTGYICEWGEYSVVNSEIPVTKPTRTTSSERDIVLVLDTSGSMDGTPLDETKKAATNFVDTILEEDASIGVVNYDSDAEMKSDFSNSKNSLDRVINSLSTGGSTNMEAGLRTADEMLTQSSAKKKIIVLMSDGEPNEGLTGDELVSYADELKGKGIYIYTLGFFESVGEKTAPQTLMEKIASDGCHYEVSDADSLVFFFGDIADQINGQKYIYVRIACPVDVSVTYNGETLDSSDKDLNTRTSFGTLTFEESDTQSDDDFASSQSSFEGSPFGLQQDYKENEGEDDKVKILRLKEGEDYDIKIEGTGRGRMNYSIGFMDENGEYTDFRRFNNIKITKNTQIDTVANVSDNSVLNVDEDGDGKYDLVYKAEANGYGEIVDYSYILYIVIGSVSVIALLILVLLIRSKIKKRKLSKIK